MRQRPLAADGTPLCYVCGEPQSAHTGGLECVGPRTLAAQEAELHDAMRALGRALLATPAGQFWERCAVWLLIRMARTITNVRRGLY